ncbi:serine/threonine protein kinase, partial [Streptomyces sp. KLMMK]
SWGASRPPAAEAAEPSRRAGAGRRRTQAVLAAVGALLVAVAVAVVLGLGLLPGGGGGKGGSGTTTGSGGGRAKSVPEQFLGTWTGQVVQSDGTPNGTMTAVIADGALGAYVVRTTYSALNVLECRSKGKLLTAVPTRLTLEEATDGTPSLGCTGETARITFSLAADGKLMYTSEDTKGGSPHATLTRRDG